MVRTQAAWLQWVQRASERHAIEMNEVALNTARRCRRASSAAIPTRILFYGRLSGSAPESGEQTLAVAAVWSAYRQDEIVDVCRLGKAASYYGLNLPAGNTG
jgi:hypothetical protein